MFWFGLFPLGNVLVISVADQLPERGTEVILVNVLFIILVFYCTIQNLIAATTVVKNFYLQDFSFE